MSKGINVKVKLWQPTISGKHPDNIVSSDYMYAKPFEPSFDRDCRPCIEQLITNDYERVWWKERNAWARLLFPPSNVHEQELIRGKVNPNLRRKMPYPLRYRSKAIFIFKTDARAAYARVRDRKDQAERAAAAAAAAMTNERTE